MITYGSHIRFLSRAGLIAAALLSTAAGSPAQEKEILARGQFHYQRYCAVCHGEHGKGNGPLVNYLQVAPADLTQLSKKNEGTFPFWRVYGTIDGREAVKGHGSREMPIWGQELRIEEYKAPPRLLEDAIAGQMWQLLSYLQSIQEP